MCYKIKCKTTRFDNYHLATRGTFRFVGEIDFKAIEVDWQYIGANVSTDQQKQHQQLAPFLKQPQDWVHHYTSANSIYWINPQTKQLLRLSNHWSQSNLPNINQCYDIRSCFWQLKGFKKDFKHNHKRQNYQIGITKLKDLKRSKYICILGNDSIAYLEYHANKNSLNK